MVRRRKGRWKVVDKWYTEVFQLLGETLAYTD
jgi:hypothetical protein